MMESEPIEGARRVDEAIDALNAVIRDVRNFIFGLRPVLLESGDLAEGLHHLGTELRRNGGVAVAVDVSASDPLAVASLPIETVAELLAITREALSNVARHADAATCTVTLATRGRMLTLEITDDGRGFDARHGAERGHHGLANMRARAAALGADYDIGSGPQHGTRMILSLPIRSSHAEDS
jgi:signal transduction histidine kinase